MTDSREEPEDAPPGEKTRGRSRGEIDNGNGIRQERGEERVEAPKGAGSPDRERRMRNGKGQPQEGSWPQYTGCCLVTPTVIEKKQQRGEEEEEEESSTTGRRGKRHSAESERREDVQEQKEYTR